MKLSERQQQLADYVAHGSDQAFAELVNGYVDLVYSAAFRLVDGDSHQAEDITQTVFIDLARLAHTLPPDVMLGGWLHRRTCFTARNIMRAERRRRAREKEAVNLLDDSSDTELGPITPVLDEAIDHLAEPDRKAILLRFFEQQDFRSVGEALGSNEDAARMRVNRALEKLEVLLKRRGITATASGLIALLSASAVQSAPVGLAASISSAAAWTGAAAQSSTALALGKATVMTALQKTAAAVVVTVVAGTGLYQAHRISQLQAQVRSLQEPLSRAPQPQAGSDRQSVAERFASLRAENEQLRRGTAELARLRGELSQLRAAGQAADPGYHDDTAVEARLWSAKRQKLTQRLAAMPERVIPEMALLQDADWQEITRQADLNSEAGVRRALSDLRKRGKSHFAELLRGAFKQYAEAHDDQLPSALADLKPFFGPEVSDAMLHRYTYNRSGQWSQLGPADGLVGEKSPVDLIDSHFTIAKDTVMTSESRFPGDDALLRVLDAYLGGDYSKEPSDLAALEAYAKTAEEREALQKFIQAESSARGGR